MFFAVGEGGLELVSDFRIRVIRSSKLSPSLLVSASKLILYLARIDLIVDLDLNVYDRAVNLFHEDVSLDDRYIRKHQESLVALLYYSRLCGLLKPYSLPAAPLLSILNRHNAIISGSAALWLLHPDSFIPGDLDIYVGGGASAPLIRDIIELSSQSYYLDESVKTEPCDYSLCDGIDTVHWLRHKTEPEDRHVNVIVVVGDDPLVAVFNFDGTHVMNFITSTGFGSAYPSLTMDKRSLLNCPPTRLFSRVGWKAKYQARGFTFTQNYLSFDVPHTCTVDASCPNTARHLRDSHMLYISFLRPGLKVEHALRHEYRNNISWQLHSSCAPERGRTGTLFSDSTAGYVFDITMVRFPFLSYLFAVNFCAPQEPMIRRRGACAC